ncbi:pyrroline-5-carboxylate reductase dimerization-domain-containing protein [Chaetomidium leptoderma]|uniref:Pyrroline-5-carboxylate reductase dimerization-domain-containing protein n=1 Tax=Chaetomidium leptoderma TaxID=669021 RepID=A0AAN6VFF2_9PEZI|nr:pyrroline-5-carboxylate reductase dimerization-domain-containing protein [Chaetomidium leptoderma]
MPATKPLPSGFTLAIIGCGKCAYILLEHVLGDLGDRVCPIEFVVGDNVEAARRADAVVLSCHPHQGSEILRVPGMSEALADKLLLSMLGGVSVTTLEDSLYAKSAGAVPSLGRCHIIQAIPNVAAARKKSITVVGDRSACMPDEALELGQEILRRIGDHAFVGTNQMAAATALCASGTAFFSWLVEAMVDAAVAEGIERSEATRMAALTMAGAAELVVSGEDPAVVTARVTTPGGATARGLAVLEHSEVKETVAIALRATTLKIRS